MKEKIWFDEELKLILYVWDVKFQEGWLEKGRSKQNQFLKGFICIFKEFVFYFEGNVE